MNTEQILSVVINHLKKRNAINKRKKLSRGTPCTSFNQIYTDDFRKLFPDFTDEYTDQVLIYLEQEGYIQGNPWTEITFNEKSFTQKKMFSY